MNESPFDDMKYRATYIAVLVLFISCCLLSVADADTIVLKTGKKLLVEKAWQDRDQVWFFFHGMKASILRKEVRYIQNDPSARNHAPADNKNIIGLQNDSVDPLKEFIGDPAPHPSLEYADSATATAQTLPLTKNGFGVLHWGARASMIDGLEQMDTQSDLEGVSEYQRTADRLQSNEVTLESVVYAFWHDRLYTITLWTRGFSNYTALRELVSATFGPAHYSDKSLPRYLWSLPSTDIMLKYIQDGQHGMLWMRCAKIDRRHRLSQISAQSSYLKWMHSQKR